MEELIKLANERKEKFPSMSVDIHAIIEECQYWISQGKDESHEVMVAREIILEITKEEEDY